MFTAEVPICRQENLKRGQSLLAVNNLAHDNMPCWGLLLVKNHCAKKMVGRVLVPVQCFDEFAFDVFPKRNQLLLLIPHILALEERHLQPLLRVENGKQRRFVNVHVSPLLVNWQFTKDYQESADLAGGDGRGACDRWEGSLLAQGKFRSRLRVRGDGSRHWCVAVKRLATDAKLTGKCGFLFSGCHTRSQFLRALWGQ